MHSPVTVTLRIREPPDIPIEAETIRPRLFVGKSLSEIERLPIRQGNATRCLSDFFDVTGQTAFTPEEMTIVVEGDLKRVKMIGAGMDGGRIKVNGDVGMYLGMRMQAGRIVVRGSVGSWAAAEMSGGNIQIEGDAGDYLCAALRGSTEGMRGGRVYVAGSAGRVMAANMRRGFIVIRGDVGEMAGAGMRGGTIVVCGRLSQRAGVHGTRGMVFVMGEVTSLPPTFRYSGTGPSEFIPYYLRYVASRRPDFVENVDYTEDWIKFQGDFAEDTPRMEVFAASKDNEHLISGV